MNKFLPDRKPIPSSYWVFYNVITRYDPMPVVNAQETSQTSLSIALDPYLQKRFSDVQVIILCTDQTAFQKGDVYVEEVAARTSTTAASTARSCINSISNAINDPPPAALVLLLELKVLSDFYLDLVPNQALAYSQLSAYILFARSYPIFLDSALSIDIRGSSKFVPENYMRRLQGLSSRYVFHVIPLEHGNRKASRFDKLHRNLLLEVAHNVWDQMKAKSAKNIRSMALVCKAWKCVIPVYFQNIGSQRLGGYIITNIKGLVRSLKCQPEMAPHITSISFHRIVPYAGFEGACADLISVSPFLSHLDISYAIYQRSKTILSEKQNIRVLRIIRYRSSEERSIHSLPEVYAVIKSWTRLVTLKVTISSVPATSHPLEAEFRPFSASFPLEELYIDAFVTSFKSRNLQRHEIAHLRYFLKATPTLRVLELHRLQNMSNQEMYELLLFLSPTLERLSVTVCTFKCTDENEELAIDAAIPHLQAIRVLLVDHRSATLLTMSRKPSCDDHCRLDLAMYEYLEDSENLDILQALEVTGWSEIRIEIPYGDGTDTDECIRVAERRGIKLILHRSY